MIQKNHYTWWTPRPIEVPEPEEQTIFVEQAHQPTKMMIAKYRDAGVRLQEYRKEQYDYGIGVEVPDGAIDPTRAPNFDLADASRILETANNNISKTKKQIEAEKAFKKKMEELDKKMSQDSNEKTDNSVN